MGFGNPSSFHLPKPRRLQWYRAEDHMEWPDGPLDTTTFHAQQYRSYEVPVPKIIRRGETNRCASTVPSDAGHATDYAPSSQLPDLQVAYPAHRVSLPTRTASRVEIGKGEWDAQTRRAIKDAIHNTRAWQAYQSQRVDTRGLRQQHSVQLAFAAPAPTAKEVAALSGKLRAAAALCAEGRAPQSSDEARPAPASRPASRAGNQAPDTSAPAPEAAAPEVEGQGGEGEGRERDDGFEDAAAVLEHWTRRGGEAWEGDAAGDERWRLKLGEAGMVGRGTARSFVPFRFPDAGTGGKSTVALGQGAEPDMYLTTNGTTYLSKRRDGVPGKRNDRQLPQHSDHLWEVQRELGPNGAHSFDTVAALTFRPHSRSASPRRVALGTFNKTASHLDVPPGEGAPLDGTTTYRTCFTDEARKVPPHVTLPHPSDATVDLRRGRDPCARRRCGGRGR